MFLDFFGEINQKQNPLKGCHFLPSGGGMGRQYSLQLLFSKKCIIVCNSTTTEASEKNEHRFGIILVLEFFKCRFG
jgi:hypothetical protein